MNNAEKLSALESVLREGARLHAFRSGGGLRVIRINRDDRLIAYGESAHFDAALLSGLQPYECVYLTGAPSARDPIDGHLLQGHTVDAFVKENRFVVQLHGMGKTDLSKVVAGQRWTSRGFTYESVLADYPPGAVSISVVDTGGRPHQLAWFWPTIQEARADTLLEALECASMAEAIEVENGVSMDT